MYFFIYYVKIYLISGDIMNIDIERLRRDLIEYFGSATPIWGVAYLSVEDIREASYEELIKLALENGFNLSDYEVYEYRR